jgi:DNA-binding transcriptional LysR family regulator
VEGDLRQLRYFLALAEELHFGAAARREHVTQQTLSRAIAQLEREVGRPLFERSTRSVALTAAGAAMLPGAQRAVSAAEDALAAARRGGDADGTAVRIDLSSAGIATGAAIVRVLSSAFPAVTTHQVEVGVSRGLELVRRDRLDVVLGLAPERPDGIEAEQVRRERVLVGVVEGHPWAGRDEVPVRDLAGVPLLLPAPEAAGEWRAFVADFCRRAGFEPTVWRHVTHGSVAAAEAVRSGGCVVPTTAWTDPPADLVFVPLADPAPVFPWSLMWRRGAGDRPGVRAVRRSARLAGRRERWTTEAGPAVRPASTAGGCQ